MSRSSSCFQDYAWREQLTLNDVPDLLLSPVDDSTDEDFERATTYAYYSVQIVDPLSSLEE